MINKILRKQEIQDQPPILLEVGASNKIHNTWRKLAPYSVCIAFDADLRDFSTEKVDTRYKKLILINKIVSDTSGKQKFYLTKNPHCSSALDTSMDTLDNWLYRDFFKVEKIVEIEATTINDVLDKLGYKSLDWFKADSQGTDLRIYRTIREEIQSKILVSEFEPGIVDAYQKEDKLFSILEYMNDNYFIDKIYFRGAHRINPEKAKNNFSRLQLKVLQQTHSLLSRESAIFGNILYLNGFNSKEIFSKRDVLLFLAILLIRKQYLFCFEISNYYSDKFDDRIFAEICRYCKNKIRFGMWKLIYFLPFKFIRKLLKKS